MVLGCRSRPTAWPRCRRPWTPCWGEAVTLAIIRTVVVVLAGWAGAELAPALEIPVPAGVLGGGVLGGLAVWLETRAVGVPVERLFWGTVGGFFGLITGLAVGAAAASLIPNAGMAGMGLPALLGAYLGAATALRRRADLEAVSAGALPRATPRNQVLQDPVTPALIDGPIADPLRTAFH